MRRKVWGTKEEGDTECGVVVVVGIFHVFRHVE